MRAELFRPAGSGAYAVWTHKRLPVSGPVHRAQTVSSTRNKASRSTLLVTEPVRKQPVFPAIPYLPVLRLLTYASADGNGDKSSYGAELLLLETEISQAMVLSYCFGCEGSRSACMRGQVDRYWHVWYVAQERVSSKPVG
jgi:hypothetical protein